MGVIAGKEYPARDVGKKLRPIIKTRHPGGRVRHQRLPAVPFLRMVDPSGSIVDVQLHNGGANAASQDPYRLYINERKRRKGFIPADRCPLMEGGHVRRHVMDEVPELLKRSPCSVTTTGKHLVERRDGSATFPFGHYCSCIEEIVAARKAAHALEEQGRKSTAETIREIQERTANETGVKMAETAAKMAEVLDRLTAAPPVVKRGPAKESRETE